MVSPHIAVALILAVFLPTMECSSFSSAYFPTIITGFVPKYSCKYLDIEARKMIASAHNVFRQGVANGTKVLEYLEYYDYRARYMTGMTYDCRLEHEAAKLVVKKDLPKATAPRGLMRNYYSMKIKKGDLWSYLTLMGNAFEHWRKTDRGSTQRLMYPKVSYMGCAAALLNSQTEHRLVCVYSDERPKFGSFYPDPSGKPCTTDRDCPHTNPECRRQLCFAKERNIIYM